MTREDFANVPGGSEKMFDDLFEDRQATGSSAFYLLLQAIIILNRMYYRCSQALSPYISWLKQDHDIDV